MVSAPLPRPFLPGSLPGSQPAARLEREPEPEFGRAAATPRRRLKVGQLSLFRAGTTVPLTRVSPAHRWHRHIPASPAEKTNKKMSRDKYAQTQHQLLGVVMTTK